MVLQSHEMNLTCLEGHCVAVFPEIFGVKFTEIAIFTKFGNVAKAFFCRKLTQNANFTKKHFLGKVVKFTQIAIFTKIGNVAKAFFVAGN